MQSDAELLIPESAAAGHGAAESVRARSAGLGLCEPHSPVQQRTLQQRGSRKGAAKGAAETEQPTDITEHASSGALQKEQAGYFVPRVGFFCLFVFNKTSSQQLVTF